MQCNLSDRNIDVVQLQKTLYSKTKLGSIENPNFQMHLWQELLSLAGCSSAAHLLATSVFIRVTGLIRFLETGWFRNSVKIRSFCQFAISHSQSIPDSSKVRKKGLNILIFSEKMNKEIMSAKSVIFFSWKNKSGELLVKLTTMNIVCQAFQIPGNWHARELLPKFKGKWKDKTNLFGKVSGLDKSNLFILVLHFCIIFIKLSFLKVFKCSFKDTLFSFFLFPCLP